MKKLTKTIAMLVLASLLMLMLSSCSSAQDTTTVPAEPIVNEAAPIQGEPELIPIPDNSTTQAEPEILPMPGASDDQFETGTAPEVESYATSGRPEGERFEGTIMMEGMEETVKYEHIKCPAIGIEMDYDYESFTRQSGPASESFISVYDNADSPENFLELIYSDENADSAAASIAEVLSMSYNIHQDTRTLDKVGSCAHIDASADKNNQTPNQLQSVYVIPLSNGCAIATMHYSFEAAEGFGRRFDAMLNTLEIIK